MTSSGVVIRSAVWAVLRSGGHRALYNKNGIPLETTKEFFEWVAYCVDTASDGPWIETDWGAVRLAEITEVFVVNDPICADVRSLLPSTHPLGEEFRRVDWE